MDAEVAGKTTTQLKEELKKRKLKTTGIKSELVHRLMAALQLEREHVDPEKNDDDEAGRNRRSAREEESNNDDDDDGSAEPDDDDEEEERRKVNKHRRKKHSNILLFRDVEGSLETFSGDDKVSIDRWITDFEEMAELCDWSDIQKVAYARRLLRGSAKLFVNYEKCTRTWKKLRKALKEEFAEIVDTHAVHRELSQCKKAVNESSQKYIYKMLEIAAQANVDTRSVIQYIINGVQDDAVNKTILYGAKTIRELKERFAQYETMKDGKVKPKQTKMDGKKKAHHKEHNSKDSKRCFNCGSKDHLGKECPKNQGT